MKEIREIIKAYDIANKNGKKSALAEVVHVNGSSYRRPGARMLVREDGALTGAISGGCLEGDALYKAMAVLLKQQSKLVTYDTSDEDDATIGIQLGCAGIIQVLFEPIDPILFQVCLRAPGRHLQNVPALHENSCHQLPVHPIQEYRPFASLG